MARKGRPTPEIAAEAAEAAPKPLSRLSLYTPDLAAAICERIASGETLVAICADPAMPSVSTVLGTWLDIPAFSQLYARAKLIRLDVMAEEITHIADTCRDGVKEKRKQVGWICPQCQKEAVWRGSLWYHKAELTLLCEGVEKAEAVYETETQTGDMVERSRLQVDARKWLLARLAAKTYGDRLELAGDKDNPIATSLTVEFVGPAAIEAARRKQLEEGK